MPSLERLTFCPWRLCIPELIQTLNYAWIRFSRGSEDNGWLFCTLLIFSENLHLKKSWQNLFPVLLYYRSAGKRGSGETKVECCMYARLGWAFRVSTFRFHTTYHPPRSLYAEDLDQRYLGVTQRGGCGNWRKFLISCRWLSASSWMLSVVRAWFGLIVGRCNRG